MNGRTATYLDYASRTPLRREVLDRMLPHLTYHFATPGQEHAFSRRAEEVLQEATSSIARCLNAATSEIQLTAGTAESNTLALLGLARCHGQLGGHIITTKFEHRSTLEACRILEAQGFQVTYLEADENGTVSAQMVKNSLRPSTFLAAVGLVNRECGTLQPIQEIGKIFQSHGVLFHCDAGPGALLGINPRQLGVHSLTLAADQVYGPQGAALLWLRHDVELDTRPVTENLASVVGLAQSLALLEVEGSDMVRRLAGLKEELRAEISRCLPSANIVGGLEGHPGILSLSMDHVSPHELAKELDRWGLSVATTSEGVRLSWGRQTTSVDLKKAVESILSALHEIELRAELGSWPETLSA